MRLPIPVLALSALASLSACGSSDTTSPATGGSIHLTAAQSTTIRSRIAQLAPVHPELAWLADTIQYVVNAGVDAQQVTLTTDLASGPFYAVSLQRMITTSFSKSAAFDVILFNDPSDPTDFVIASGWTNPGNVATSPTSVSGSFGAPTATSTVNASLFHVSGSTVTAWRATAGTASFSLGDGPAGSCSSITNSATVTCQPADLNASFTITAAAPDNGSTSGTKTASVAQTVVGGIIIRMIVG